MRIFHRLLSAMDEVLFASPFLRFRCPGCGKHAKARRLGLRRWEVRVGTRSHFFDRWPACPYCIYLGQRRDLEVE